ncbi:MAG: hypothetical protein HRT43_08150 [Campylobacteraceae bacterium]|nr:hypothetical protein [Campylobacteraceae bacterium]
MDKQDSTIYYLKNEDIKNQDILFTHIYSNMESNYYWSDDFSEDFYVNLAYAGFISVSNYIDEKFLLLPEIQFEYAVLDFSDLHISNNVQKLLAKNEYKLSVNEHFEDLLSKIEFYHDNCWLSGKYLDLVKKLKNYRNDTLPFKLISVELSCSKTNSLIAGELGYIIGSTYTSLTGFCNKEKQYNNWGTLQLVLWAQYLEKEKLDFWNLGHAAMDYKLKLGAKVYSRVDFLNRWIPSTKKQILKFL